MFGIQNYASFIAAIFIFQLVPGAGVFAILNATARNGVTAGLGAIAGTILGDFIYMVGAVLGLAAVMYAYPFAFELLQWFGVVYLCWLGIQLLWASIPDEGHTSEPKKNGALYFRQAFLISLTNPKVILFFMAFFPLFLRADASSMTLVAVMAHVIIISFLCQISLVLLGNAATRKLSSWPPAHRVATRLAGITLIGFGIKLAANNR